MFVLGKAEPEKKAATPKAKAGKVASMCHLRVCFDSL